jgi:hypothetical protein
MVTNSKVLNLAYTLGPKGQNMVIFTQFFEEQVV